MTPEVKENVNISEFTTIKLGGPARFFVNCISEDQIRFAINFAKEKSCKLEVISGGSNVVFPDAGFDGVVAKIDTKGIQFLEEDEHIVSEVMAGENWDDFVLSCIQQSLSGIECMSGIPGSVGATPVQNVGAYGQEVREVIQSVEVMDRESLERKMFLRSECNFSYRESRFKSAENNRYIITKVKFRFKKNSAPNIKYAELISQIERPGTGYHTANLKEKLFFIRDAVLKLRKSKSMIIDANDPDSKSCGSFFKNPVIGENKFNLLKDISPHVPNFKYGKEYKIPAAWLIEQSGYGKGYVKGGVGISKKHSLALININGTTEELLGLANEIVKSVNEKFDIALEREPVVIESPELSPDD